MIAQLLTYAALLLLSLPLFWNQVVLSPYLSHVEPTKLAQHPSHSGVLCLLELAGSLLLAGLAWLLGGLALGLDLRATFTPLRLSLFSIAQFILCTKLRAKLMHYHSDYLDSLERPPHKRTAVVDYDSYLVIHNCFYLLVLSIALWLVGRWS